MPFYYRKRMRDYFDDYGCMRCGRLDVPYKTNAMCQACQETVSWRLKASAYRRMKERLPTQYGKDFIKKALLARSLLREFSRQMDKNRNHPRVRMVQLGSPIASDF
jgi:hypothetical protein